MASSKVKLNWPDSLGDITLRNINLTEVWFLKERLVAGDYNTERVDDYSIEVRTPKFGYDECYLVIGDDKYLVKHRTEARPSSYNMGSWDGAKNVVFYIRKHKRKQK